mgnify:CR=1 FL=1
MGNTTYQGNHRKGETLMAKKLGGLGKGLNAIFIENDSEKGDGAVSVKIYLKKR